MIEDKIKIRETKLKDIPQICSIYDNKDEIILKWILLNLKNTNELCSFVAVNQNNTVIGHVGFTQNKYRLNNTELIGVHPIEWRIDRKVKGSLGIMLLKKVTCLGDFNIIIGGTKDAQLLYPLFGFKKSGNAKVYSKIINYPLFLFSRKSFKKKIITVYKTKYNINQITKRKYYKNISFKTVREIHSKLRTISELNRMNMVFDESKIDWLLNCPSHESYLIQINYFSDLIGSAILYFNLQTKYIRVISIISIEEKVETYIRIIKGIICFSKTLKAIEIDVLSTNEILIRALERNNYFCKSVKPMFTKINNDKLLNKKKISDILITYAEGDIGYRF